jgi:hypothetical protein
MHHCPYCGHELQSIKHYLEHTEIIAKPGDYSLCFRCEGLLVFDENLREQLPTPQQRREADTNENVIEAKKWLKEVKLHK